MFNQTRPSQSGLFAAIMEDNPTNRRKAPHPIIHINAFPGTGKKTIATQLENMLSSSGHPAKLVHNHMLINPAKLPRTHPGYRAERKSIREEYFKPLVVEPHTYGTTYIFTDCQSTDDIGSAVCKEYAALAANRRCLLIPITLSCEEEENLSRAVSHDRAEHGKLTDVEMLRGFLRSDITMYRFPDPTPSLELDVTALSAKEAAERLQEHVLRTYEGWVSLSRTEDVRF